MSWFTLSRVLPMASVSLALVAASCGSSSEPVSRGGTGGASAGSGASGNVGTGGGVVIDPNASGGMGATSGGGYEYRPPDGPKWEYYATDTERGYKDPSLSDGVRDVFGGGAASDAPSIVYPLHGSMHPLNIGMITFQWTRANGASVVVRIDAKAGGQTYSFFVPCEKGQCTYQMPRNEWLDMAWREKGAAVTFTVSETDGKGGPVGVSTPVTLHFTPDPTIGALYYWSTNESGLKRVSIGDDHASLFVAPRTPANELNCGACHSLSRDGKTISYTIQEAGESGESPMAIVVASTTAIDQPYRKPTIASEGGLLTPKDELADKTALSPDGKYVLVNGAVFSKPPYERFVELQEAETGTVLDSIVFSADAGKADPRIGANKFPVHFEWSADGTQVVFALDDTTKAGCHWTFMASAAELAVAPVTTVAGKPKLGTPQILVKNAASASDNFFYPTWSPDGKYIAFTSSTECSNDAERTMLRMVPTSGGPHECPGPKCYDLQIGTGHSYADLGNPGTAVAETTWPKFAPFAQGSNRDLFFIAYSSRRDYGFLSYGATNLWMFAVDVSRLPGDPSFTPLFLPFQQTDDGGLYPFWTETLPCDIDPAGGCVGCVTGETCQINSERTSCSCRAEDLR